MFDIIFKVKRCKRDLRFNNQNKTSQKLEWSVWTKGIKWNFKIDSVHEHFREIKFIQL